MTTIIRNHDLEDQHPNEIVYDIDDVEGVPSNPPQKYIAICDEAGQLSISRVGPGPVYLTPGLIQAIDALAIAHDILPLPDPTQAIMRAEIIVALIRAAQWLGKMIADGGHLNSVAPQNCVNTLTHIESLVERIDANAI